MNRRTLIGAVAASAALPLLNRVASAQTSPKTRNVVFVHGLFADGSCWSKVIARLQLKGVNCTSVQNPLTSLHEASDAARRAIAAQPGPTVLVGHSFSGMIVTDVGVDAPRPPGQIDARSAQRARRDRQARRGLPFAQGHLGRHYDPHGRLMLTVLGGLAEFERELIRWPPLFSGSPDYATIPLTTMAKSGPFTTER